MPEHLKEGIFYFIVLIAVMRKLNTYKQRMNSIYKYQFWTH